jgi:hypothetical protein
MRTTRGSSWQSGLATARHDSQRPALWRGLEALHVPALGNASLNNSAATLVDLVRRRDATATGALTYQRTNLGPSISLLGSGARLVASNTADRYNFVHQTARFSVAVLLRLSLVGLAHTVLDNAIGQSTNTGLTLSIDTSGRPSLQVSRGVLGSPVVGLTATTALSANVYYLIAATCDGVTARLFIDGRPESTTAAVGTLAAGNAASRLNLGGRDDGVSAMRGNLLLTALWSRPLGQHELRALAGDPFVLLQKRPQPTRTRVAGPNAWLQASNAFVPGACRAAAHRAGGAAGCVVR